jgi:hypothetical protein
MKNFQKMLLILISVGLLTGCQSSPQQEIEEISKDQDVIIQEAIEKQETQEVDDLEVLDEVQDIDEDMNDFFSFLIPVAQAALADDYNDLKAFAKSLKQQVKDGVLEMDEARKEWVKAHAEFIKNKEAKILAKITMISKRSSDLAEKLKERFDKRKERIAVSKNLREKLKNGEITKEELKNILKDKKKEWEDLVENWKKEVKVIKDEPPKPEVKVIKDEKVISPSIKPAIRKENNADKINSPLSKTVKPAIPADKSEKTLPENNIDESRDKKLTISDKTGKKSFQSNKTEAKK